MNGSELASPTMAKWTRPAMTSSWASAAPLNPTCLTLMPEASLKRSPFMCVELPTPAWLKMSSFGLAFARSTSSWVVLTPVEGDVISAVVENPSRVMPAKSLVTS